MKAKPKETSLKAIALIFIASTVGVGCLGSFMGWLEAKNEFVKRQLEERQKPVEKRKYPKALPGGGLDWTGVEGH
jgi:hypothetical protein